MNRKRRLVKGDIDSERAKVEQSDIYRAGCHELIGPVDQSKCADLMLKILTYAKSRMSADDFHSLLHALKHLENESKYNVESVAGKIAHSCRLNPEIMGLLCAVVPAELSSTEALRESNASLRAVREFFLCCLACGSDPASFLISSLSSKVLPETSILKRAKLSNRPYLRTLLANLQSDETPSGDLLDDLEEINFDDWQKSGDATSISSK